MNQPSKRHFSIFGWANGGRGLGRAGALGTLLLALACPGGRQTPPAGPVQAVKVKAVILDIGNVLVEVNPERARPYFRAAGVPLGRGAWKDQAVLALVDAYMEGKVETRAFMARFARLQGSEPIPEERFRQAWNAIVPAFLPGAVEAVPQFRARGYRVFALSDNDALHTAHIQRLYRQGHGGREFFALFDKCYLSQVTGHTKRSDAAWLDILKEQNLRAEECLFVDDHLPNIARARSLGFQVFHFGPGARMPAVLAELEHLERVGS